MFKDFNVYNSLIQLGINGFVPKDAELSEIRDAIQCVMRKDSYFSKELLLNIVKNNSQNIRITLSNREQEILELICKGFSNEEIGTKLCISKRTIEKNRSELMKKMNCHNSISLILYAIKHGLVEIQDGLMNKMVI